MDTNSIFAEQSIEPVVVEPVVVEPVVERPTIILASVLPVYYQQLSNYYKTIEEKHRKAYPDKPDQPLVLFCSKIMNKDGTVASEEVNLFPPNTFVLTSIHKLEDLSEFVRAAFDWQFTDLPNCVFEYIFKVTRATKLEHIHFFVDEITNIQCNFRDEICNLRQTYLSKVEQIAESRKESFIQWVNQSFEHRLSTINGWFNQMLACISFLDCSTNIYDRCNAIVKSNYSRIFEYVIMARYGRVTSVHNMSIEFQTALNAEWIVGMDIIGYHCGMSVDFKRILQYYTPRAASTGNLPLLQYIHKTTGKLGGKCASIHRNFRRKHSLTYIALLSYHGGHLDCVQYIWDNFSVLPNISKVVATNDNVCYQYVINKQKLTESMVDK